MSNFIYDWNTVVIQPTSLCNLNCNYCYLPNRLQKKFVGLEVVEKVADALATRNTRTLVLWHGGEPLLTGIENFSKYMDIFDKKCNPKFVQHSLQTNATLIDDDWCRFFIKNNFRVGISLDGNSDHNKARVSWAKKDSFDQAVKGASKLRDYHIPFGIIAVVNRYNLEEPEKMYNFLSSLKPRSISINFEENEGLNAGKASFTDKEIDEFWQKLFLTWKDNPVVAIRHFRDVIEIMNKILIESNLSRPKSKNIYPTVDSDGNVVLLSPEFISTPNTVRNRFVVGNILNKDLNVLVKEGTDSWYVKDFMKGVDMCEKTCKYFVFCEGGQASNKYFENNSLQSTVTQYCKASRMGPAQVVLDYINSN